MFINIVSPKSRYQIEMPPSVNTVGCEPVPVTTSWVCVLVSVPRCLRSQRTSTTSTQWGKLKWQKAGEFILLQQWWSISQMKWQGYCTCAHSRKKHSSSLVSTAQLTARSKRDSTVVNSKNGGFNRLLGSASMLWACKTFFRSRKPLRIGTLMVTYTCFKN